MKWFQVDSDTPNDPKIRAVLRELGPAGVGGLFLLWCHIADHGTRRPGFSIDTQGKPMRVVDLVDASRLTLEQFERLVDLCLESGHFLRGPWQQKKIIAIPAMARRADTYTRRTAAGAPDPQYGKSGMTRLEIFARDDYRCSTCRSKRTADRLEVTLKIPREQGGTDEASNLRTICRSCNRKKPKGSRVLDEADSRQGNLLVENTSRISSRAAYKTVQDSTVQEKKEKAAAAPPAVDFLREAERNVPILTRLAFDVIDEIGPQHPDLSESLKCLAAKQRVAYSGRTIAKALESALWQRVHGRQRTGT